MVTQPCAGADAVTCGPLRRDDHYRCAAAGTAAGPVLTLMCSLFWVTLRWKLPAGSAAAPLPCCFDAADRAEDEEGHEQYSLSAFTVAFLHPAMHWSSLPSSFRSCTTPQSPMN